MLRSIPEKTRKWLDYRILGTNSSRSSGGGLRRGISPSTLDREQQILESAQLSCQHLQQWTRCYKERINIQIQLDFNRLTSDIAWEAQRDTSAMNNVAIVTTLFLPGAFVCAVFSMVFFDTDEAGYPRPSPKAYIYAVITIPLTLVVAFALWFVNGISHAWRLRDFDRLRYEQVGEGSGQSPTFQSWMRSGVLHTPS